MRSFIRNSLKSNPDSRNRRLALTLLVSFCLTYMGQAFAMPMICTMSASEMAALTASSLPCHQMISEASASTQPIATIVETAADTDTMDCCDHMDSLNDTGLTISSDDCTCPDGGCGASLTFLTSFSCSALTISGQPHYYSTIGFPNQIDSALFRPPIA